MSRPTVTLCMIVKDEEHIIHECLNSMIPYIDRFDITDTGSTDRPLDRDWETVGLLIFHPLQLFTTLTM